MVIIIGKRSNLSKELNKIIEDSILVSSKENFEKLVDSLNLYQKSIKVIFNNFQASTSLYDVVNLDKYIENSVYKTAKILNILDDKKIKIDKIIYTSSSSVYGNNKFCSEIDQVMPMSLQAALKVANEELVKRFCVARGIDYTITRIFNMYGGEDRFSVISKIKDAHANNQPLNIINGGMAVRDYIHIEDVVKVYKKILKSKNSPVILNIASGNGKRVHDILNHLKSKNINIEINNQQRDEIKASIANIDLLNTLLDTSNFTQVEDYLLQELQLK